MRRNAEFGHCLVEAIENSMVTAACTPAHGLVTLIIGGNIFDIFHRLFLHYVGYCIDHFFNEERLALYFVDAEYVDLREFALQIVGEHAGIQLSYNYFLITRQHLSGIGGQRIDVAEVGEGYLMAGGVKLMCRSAEMSVGSTPSEQQCVGIVRTDYFEAGDIVGYRCNLLTAGVDHAFMVDGVSADGTCGVVLFQTAKTVGEAFGAGDSPVAYLVVLAAVIWAP